MMTENTRVLYNADCPVCRAEIDHYAAYSAKNALPIRFDDLNSDALKAWGLSTDAATRRLHVLKNGTLYSGIPAFVALWQDMPRYRKLARVVALPGVHWLAVQTYDHILAPLLYRWHLRRQKRVAETSTQS
jgi:predicted DCC family thiol-disulfide oxidoreductase YuxK